MRMGYGVINGRWLWIQCYDIEAFQCITSAQTFPGEADGEWAQVHVVQSDGGCRNGEPLRFPIDLDFAKVRFQFTQVVDPCPRGRNRAFRGLQELLKPINGMLKALELIDGAATQCG